MSKITIKEIDEQIVKLQEQRKKLEKAEKEKLELEKSKRLDELANAYGIYKDLYKEYCKDYGVSTTFDVQEFFEDFFNF